MLSIANTHIPPEVVKQSEKLQALDNNRPYPCKNCSSAGCDYCGYTGFIRDIKHISIADIISDTEMLFNSKYVAGHEILKMCQNNKSIEEISKYIIDNIKEV